MHTIHFKSAYVLFSIILFSFLLSSCAFSRLETDLKEMDQLVTMKGVVKNTAQTSSPIFVALLTENPIRPALLDYRIMTEPGEFTFLVNPGIYRIYAFEDINSDQEYQKNERIAHSEHLELLDPGANNDNIVITLPDTPDQTLAHKAQEIQAKASLELPNYRLNTGKIVTLDEKFFSYEYALMGMWEPMRFIRYVPFGLFFLQEYDPKKTPVLFVHGITGSPANFQPLINLLDLEKFQPWVFYYPSGLPLALVAEVLNFTVEELHTRYMFQQLVVIAHSMGGLVSRAFINYHLEKNQNVFVKAFISIATPWSGHKAAATGVKHAPAVVPVWKDIAPDSTFLETLFLPHLPKELPYYLLFSFRGKSSSSGENNDGIVSLASQLRTEAQKNAARIQGFNEDHTSILSSKNVSGFLNSILSKIDKIK